MAKVKPNLAMEEAELTKVEELNRRKKKALAEQADLIRQEKELAAAEAGDDPPVPGTEEGRGTINISDELADVLTQLEEKGKFWVTRISESGRESVVGGYPVADWPAKMEEIAQMAGGGTFKIVFKNGKGQYVTQTTQTFDPIFYGSKKQEGSLKEDGGMSTVLLEMQKQSSTLAAESRRDMLTMMQTMMTAMTAAMTNKPTGPDYKDIAVLGEIFGKKSGDGGVVEGIKMGIDLASRFSEGKEPPSTLDKILETVGAPAAALLTRLSAPGTLVPRAPAPGTMPRPLTDPPAALPAPVVQVPEDPVKAHPFYRTYAPKILDAAKKNEDPKEWAEMICDMVPALYHPKLLDILQKPDLVEYLGSFEPEARNFAVWIVKTRDEITALFPPEDVPSGIGGSFTPAPPGSEPPAALVQAMTE